MYPEQGVQAFYRPKLNFMHATSPSSPPQPEGEPRAHPITFRAILLGACCVAFMAWGGHYTRHIGHTTKMAQDHLPWGVVVPFFVIAVILNKLLEKLRPRWVLTPSELLVIFSMASIASALPSYFMAHLIANIAAPFYYASPENFWATDLHPHLPSWAVLTDRTAVRWFFEGLPAGAPIPWSAWAVPLFWRLSLVLAIACFCYCVVAILRKQWVEHERLSFALMALPLHMVEREPRGTFPVGFMNTRLFWVGFALSSLQIYWNMVGYFVPLFPEIPRDFGTLQFGRDFPPIYTRIYPLIIGVTYFVDLDISLSIVLFHFLLNLQMGFLNRLGADIGPTHEAGNTQFENWQDLGALFFIVPWGLWMARGHLKAVFRKAFLGDPSVDDSRELLPYRQAVIGLIASAGFITAWCMASGMSLTTACVFFALVVLIWLGITRISIEGGLISSRTIQAQSATYHLVGPVHMTAAGIVAVAMTKNWHHDLKSALMAPMANASRLMDPLRTDRWRLLLAVLIAIVGVVGGSAYYQIASGYETGAFNYGAIFRDYVQSTFNGAVGYVRDPFSLNRERAWGSLLGFMTCAVTALLRYALPWWPLHPIGFVTATTYPAKRVPFSILIAWFAKLTILRTGGIGLYRRSAPLFFGLILGYFVGVGVSFVVDLIWFPGQGHSLALY